MHSRSKTVSKTSYEMTLTFFSVETSLIAETIAEQFES
ncbi:hypothetical protein [Azospirillum melinis]